MSKYVVCPGKCVSFAGKARPEGSVIELPDDAAQRLLAKGSISAGEIIVTPDSPSLPGSAAKSAIARANAQKANQTSATDKAIAAITGE
jgi:hypothetical protein